MKRLTSTLAPLALGPLTATGAAAQAEPAKAIARRMPCLPRCAADTTAGALAPDGRKITADFA